MQHSGASRAYAQKYAKNLKVSQKKFFSSQGKLSCLKLVLKSLQLKYTTVFHLNIKSSLKGLQYNYAVFTVVVLIRGVIVLVV